MPRGKPDYHRATIMEGYDGANFIPLLVDEDGQLYSVMVGDDGGTPRLIKVDAQGRMMSRMTGMYGPNPKDVAVDADGNIVTRIKGSFGGLLRDVKVDVLGRLIGIFQGHDGIDYQDIYVDDTGRMIARIQGVAGGDEPLFTIEDGGDTGDILDWVQLSDGLEALSTSDYVKEGSKAIKLRVDASKSPLDKGGWRNADRTFNLDGMQHNWIYLWVYFPTLEYLTNDEPCLKYKIGSSVANWVALYAYKISLSQGWNLLKLDLDNPIDTAGDVDWTAIDFQIFEVISVTDNTDDYFCVLDSIIVVKPNEASGTVLDVATDKDGLLMSKMLGDYAGLQKPIICTKHGILKNDISNQSLRTQVSNTHRGGIKHIYKNRLHPALETYTMCDISGAGMIAGGFLRHYAIASHNGCGIQVTIDGVTIQNMSFFYLDYCNVNNSWNWIFNMIKYDDPNNEYMIGFPHGITFETQFKIEVTEVTAGAATSNLYLLYSLF